MKQTKRLLILALGLLLLIPLLSAGAEAADLDEILLYEITVDVNEDATLRMVYHIDWKVLDSDSEGPLSWVEIGIPNRHTLSMTGLSGAVRKISESGGYARVDLDREYYAGEVADIEFEIVQDYMYEVNRFSEGETVYEFTPGWFDSIRVDALTIRWNSDRALSQTPACQIEGGYYTWTSSLDKGDRYTVTVTYPNEAFAFDESKSFDPSYYDSGDSDNDAGYAALGLIFFLGIVFCVVYPVVRLFSRSANFSSGTQKKITRTRIVYYPECQGCGSTRPEGASNCPYCGRSFIKSEEVIKASDIPEADRSLRSKNTNGLYRYTSQPNTYVRINVVNVPAPRVSHSSSSHSSVFRSSGGGHSSGGTHGGGGRHR